METKKASRSTFSILYYINKTRKNKSGECPIYVRLSVNATQTAMSVQRSVNPAVWSAEAGQPIGNTAPVRELRKYMEQINAKIYDCHKVLKDEHGHITADMLREAFTHGVTKKKNETLFFDLADEFIKRQEEVTGIDTSQLTVNRYKMVRNTFEAFLLTQGFTRDSFLITNLSKVLIQDFEHYLKAVKKSGHNNAMKYLQRLKKFIVYCEDRKLLEANPYNGVKISMKKSDRGYLTESELQTLIEKDFGVERLNVVRDMFIFSCMTGLAYIDSKNLTRSNIEAAPDGTLWIRTHRQKTDSRSNIPILPIALTIINKYADLDTLAPDEKLLPLCSNQKMNAYLKEISTICKIDKRLTTHLTSYYTAIGKYDINRQKPKNFRIEFRILKR